MTSSQRLSHLQRVRRRPDFERAYETGARVRGAWLTLFAVPNGLPQSRFGVAASRKVGSAVHRNRAKRLAREIFRRHNTTRGLDIVVVPRRELLDAPFSKVESDYLAALRRITRSVQGSKGDRDPAGAGRTGRV